jgi:hypothetical protein
VEVFKEREGPGGGQEIHEIARDPPPQNHTLQAPATATALARPAPDAGIFEAIEDAGVRGRSCRSSCSGRCLQCVVLWGGREEEGERAAAPRDATVPGARAPLDVRGGIEVEHL